MALRLTACLAFTAESASNPDLGYGVIVAIYIFEIFFAWGWTPLQTLYAVECLENRTRAKGSGLNFLFINVVSNIAKWKVRFMLTATLRL